MNEVVESPEAQESPEVLTGSEVAIPAEQLDEHKVNEILFAMPLHELAKNRATIAEYAQTNELTYEQKEILEAFDAALAGRADFLIRKKIGMEAQLAAMVASCELVEAAIEKFGEYLEFATVNAGGLIKGDFFTAEMKKPGGADPLEVTDISLVPEFYKKHSITVRETISADDKAGLRYWQTIVLGHEPPEDEKLMSSAEIAKLDSAIKTEVMKDPIKQILKAGGTVKGVAIVERPKKLVIKEMKKIEKKVRAKKATEAITQSTEQEGE
jgi:hypothetical protein